MEKLAILLFLFGTTAVVWQQAEAKPFLFLPANFFVLTTRAPSTDSTSFSTSTSYSSPPTSSAFGGIFQLPINIISRKLSFLNSLLSSFSGGAGGGGNIGAGGIVGGSGKFGGSFGLGFKFNAGPTTQRTTTEVSTEANSIFTPQSTTNAPKSTTGNGISYSTDSTTTTSTEKSLVSTTTAALSSTTAKTVSQVPYISTTESSTTYHSSTSKPIVDTTVSGVTSDKPTLVTEQPVYTITTEKATTNLDTSTESFITMETFNTVKATITPTTQKYSPDVDFTSEAILSITTTTEEHSSDVDSTSEAALTTTTTTEKHSSDVDSISEAALTTTTITEEHSSDVDSTSEAALTTITTTEKHSSDVDYTSEAILSTTSVASVRPTVVAQNPVIVTTTESGFEAVATTEDNGSLNTTGYVYDMGKPETKIVTESVTNTGYNYRRNEESMSNGVSGSGYAYKKPSSEGESKIFSGDMYLPVL